MKRRIYLDNAATSWPKPETVYAATDRFQREIGASAGRGGYSAALQARAVVEDTRSAIQAYFGAPHGSEVIFAFNGTDALNLCFHGVLVEPCHVITSVAEHNSVLRPLSTLARRRSIDVTYAPCDEQGVVLVDAIARAITPRTRLIAITHASNVTGAIQPVETMAEIAQRRGVWLLVDAAQTAGHLPIRLTDLPIDFLATSGHKGLLGPLGTACVCFSPGLAERVLAYRQGGTGTSSDSDEHPNEGVEKFEAGNHNAVGLAGLAAGIEYVTGHADQIRTHELALTSRILEGLGEIPRVAIPGPSSAEARVGVVAFKIEGWDCHEVAHTLELTQGIQVRAGVICAPRMHASLGLPQGTVRASVGPFTTEDDVDALLDGVREIATS